MLQITKYYKTIFLGFIQSSFASVENQSVLDKFSNAKNKEHFFKQNADGILNALDSLDGNSDKNIKLNEKQLELFKQIGISGEQIISREYSPELKDKLNKFNFKLRQIKGITIIDIGQLKEVINTNTFTKTLKKGAKGSDVMNLQQFLVNKGLLAAKRSSGKTNIDSKFGKDTRDALKLYQETIYLKGNKFVDGVLTLNGKTMKSIINENSTGIRPFESATSKEVITAAKKATESMAANIDMLKKSKEFYEALEAREDGGYRKDILSDTGSILGWLREVFGANKASEYFKKMKSYKKVLKNPKIQDKFNKGYEFLVKNTSTRNSSLALYGFRDVLMALFAGIPLFDVRLNFAKSLQKSGIDMPRATLFTNWVESGMNKSFENYEKQNGKSLNTGESMDKDLNSLKATITAYISNKMKKGEIPQAKITKELVDEVRKSDTELDKTITAFINNRGIPDVETLLAGGFNIFEHFTDTKYDEIKSKLEKLHGKEKKLDVVAQKVLILSSGAELPQSKRDVFLLKNKNKYYLHIGSEYKEFDKKPTPKEITESIKEYNKLSNITRAGKNGIWNRLDLNPSDNESDISNEEKIKILNEIRDLLRQQNAEGVANLFGQGKMTEHLKPFEDRLEYYGILYKKNSKFLKETVQILNSTNNISDEVKKNFGLINRFNSTGDFLNAYSALPKKVKDEIIKLDHSKLSPEEYVSKLQELSQIQDVKEALTAIKGGFDTYQKYRLNELKSRKHNVPPEHRIDAGLFKYGTRMLTKKEFNMPYIELQAEYKTRYEILHKKFPKNKKIIQEFKAPKTFKEVYSFEQKGTYKEYLDKLSQTGPNLPDETDGKYWTTTDLHEREAIEQGLLNFTGKEIDEAIRDRGEDVNIQDYFENPGDFVNTARQAGYKHDLYTSFKQLAENRGDKKVKHATIDKSYSFPTTSGDNIKIDIIYDIFTRPECQNMYILPNSKSIQETKTYLKLNPDVSILNTPSIPVGLFNILTGKGTGGFKSNGGNTAAGGVPGIVPNPNPAPL